METPVSVSLGIVRSLPAKLETLLSPEAGHGLRLREGEKNKIRLLKDQLQELIDKYLMEPSEVETPTSTARCWVKEVRELSYDIDDFLDELAHGLHGTSAAGQANLRGRIARLREGLSRSRWVADEISRFRARLEEAIQRHKRFDLDKRRSRPMRIDSDEPPIPPLYGVMAPRLVGIDSSMEKLAEWLTGEDGERRLRVVSIVGLGGLGKTTLARELYFKLGRRFECRAFARSSQKPDMRRLLTSILLQVRPHRPPDDLELRNLTDTIRAHLQHKKYFIIIDELWASSTWDIIHHALPNDKCCSRVLTTTEIDVVAQKCCGHKSKHIFKMEPLSDKEPSELFFSRLAVNQSENREEFNEVSSEIIRKCGGFPLATIATASLLARQQDRIEHGNYIRRSLSSNLRTNPTMEGMKQVLNLCYNNLPDRLKACMLYLSIYNEGHIILKDDLVKQWITEGYICAKEGKHMEEVAGSYFDELVHGGMIQPVDINYDGEVLSCTVHYMVLNLIRYRSIEENFVTAIDHSQTNTRLADKVRRLSLDFGDADDPEPPANLRLSQVRSLVFFGLFESLPSIVDFRLLQVLILHLWGDQDNKSFDLTTVCKLFRLRYLEIVCNVTLNLQTEMQGLQCLETLKIDSRVSEVPKDIVHLPGLLHLSLPGDTNLPNGIGRMETLQTLGRFDLTTNSACNVLSLGELTNLRDLRLTCSTVNSDYLKTKMECLGSVLSKLRNLKSLTLLGAGSCNTNILEASASSNDISCDLSNVSSPPTLLQKLELMPRICILSVLPEWIGKLRLLSILKIEVMGLSGGDIDILKGLPALAALSLYVRTAPAERIICHREGFPVLKHFMFISSALCVAFVEGAMPSVRRLNLGFNADRIEQFSPVDAGFKHLTGLEVFSAEIGGAGGDESTRKAVQSALEDALSEHPSHPIINIQPVDWIFVSRSMRATDSSLATAQLTSIHSLSSNQIRSPITSNATHCTSTVPACDSSSAAVPLTFIGCSLHRDQILPHAAFDATHHTSTMRATMLVTDSLLAAAPLTSISRSLCRDQIQPSTTSDTTHHISTMQTTMLATDSSSAAAPLTSISHSLGRDPIQTLTTSNATYHTSTMRATMLATDSSSATAPLTSINHTIHHNQILPSATSNATHHTTMQTTMPATDSSLVATPLISISRSLRRDRIQPHATSDHTSTIRATISTTDSSSAGTPLTSIDSSINHDQIPPPATSDATHHASTMRATLLATNSSLVVAPITSISHSLYCDQIPPSDTTHHTSTMQATMMATDSLSAAMPLTSMGLSLHCNQIQPPTTCDATHQTSTMPAMTLATDSSPTTMLATYSLSATMLATDSLSAVVPLNSIGCSRYRDQILPPATSDATHHTSTMRATMAATDTTLAATPLTSINRSLHDDQIPPLATSDATHHTSTMLATTLAMDSSSATMPLNSIGRSLRHDQIPPPATSDATHHTTMQATMPTTDSASAATPLISINCSLHDDQIPPPATSDTIHHTSTMLATMLATDSSPPTTLLADSLSAAVPLNSIARSLHHDQVPSLATSDATHHTSTMQVTMPATDFVSVATPLTSINYSLRDDQIPPPDTSDATHHTSTMQALMPATTTFNPNYHTSASFDPEVDTFQCRATELLTDLLATDTASPDLLSLAWTWRLLDSFVLCLEEFQVLLISSAAGPMHLPLNHLVADFFDCVVKALDICNAVRDGLDAVRQWHKHLASVILASLPDRATAAPLRKVHIHRARKALTDLTILMLDNRDAGGGVVGHENRDTSHGQGHHRQRSSNCKSSGSGSTNHLKPLSWSVPRAWSAARQLQEIGGRLPVASPHDITATGGLASAVYTMTAVLFIVAWALVAAIPCQDRGLQAHFSVPRNFPWSGPATTLYTRILEESRKKERKNSRGLLKEFHQIEKLSRHLMEITDATELPLPEDKDAEVREAAQELVQVCVSLKDGLDLLERQVREMVHRIARARTEILYCLSFGHPLAKPLVTLNLKLASKGLHKPIDVQAYKGLHKPIDVQGLHLPLMYKPTR